MATEVQVSCINKREHQDPHERITHIGGLNPDGTRWKLAETHAIQGIETGQWTFIVNVQGVRVRVIVAMHAGRKYLKTENDGYEPNNLLSLPECP